MNDISRIWKLISSLFWVPPLLHAVGKVGCLTINYQFHFHIKIIVEMKLTISFSASMGITVLPFNNYGKEIFNLGKMFPKRKVQL
jgi:hypothetical protein